MDITWYGLSCFRMVARGQATIVTDPYGSKLGLSALQLTSDIVTISHASPGHANVDAVKGYRHSLTGPGEYEIGGVFLTGVATEGHTSAERNVLFQYDFGNLTIVHLGDLGKMPTQAQLEALGDVNVLLLPVGGGNSLNASQAGEIVSMLQPNIVVPMHYQIPNIKIELDPIERFLKEMGLTDISTEPVLKVTASSLPEETQTILLEPKQ